MMSGDGNESSEWEGDAGVEGDRDAALVYEHCGMCGRVYVWMLRARDGGGGLEVRECACTKLFGPGGLICC